MTISYRNLTQDVAVVTLSGRVTLGPLSGQIVSVTEQLLREGKQTIIFDLAGVTAIDSTGIGHFISSYNKAVAARGKLRIAGATAHLLDVFRVSRLDTVFPIYPTVKDAEAA